MHRLKGKVALITGGGTGIGAATARRLAAEGAHVVVTGRRAANIERIASEINGIAVVGSTTDEQHLSTAVASAVERFGGLDILVANAGTHIVGSVERIDLEILRSGIAVNLEGAILAARHAIPEMRKRGSGSIVLVASTAAFLSYPNLAGYMMSKAAMLGLNRSLAVDCGIENIRSNVVCPAYIRSEMMDDSLAQLANAKGCSVDEMSAVLAKPIPLRRMGLSTEVASAIAFLASQDASFITGATLIIDGGNSIVDPSASAFGG